MGEFDDIKPEDITNQKPGSLPFLIKDELFFKVCEILDAMQIINDKAERLKKQMWDNIYENGELNENMNLNLDFRYRELGFLVVYESNPMEFGKFLRDIFGKCK